MAADLNGYSDPYVRVLQGSSHWQSKTIHKNLNPSWNETTSMVVTRPQEMLLVVEVFDKDAVGKDDLIGFTVVDLGLLPKGVEVVTTENLSWVPHGSITLGLTATNFGLEVAPDYAPRYIGWKNSLPSVSKKGFDKAKDSGKKKDKHGKAGKAPAATKPAGPFANKIPPHGYSIMNGHVKRNKSEAEKAMHAAGKAAKSGMKFVGKILG